MYTEKFTLGIRSFIVTPQSINKGNTDMPIKTLDQRIQEVQSALAQGFTTKSGKKDTMYSLSWVFDEVKDVLKDAVWDVERSTGERIEGSFDIICKQLHHFKVEHIEFFAQYNSHNQKAISDLYKVLDLRDQIKAADPHASFEQLLQVCLCTMVHEMQMPLDIMLQTIDQLAESELGTMSEAQLKALSTLQRQVQALEHIIDGLTYISAVSGKK